MHLRFIDRSGDNLHRIIAPSITPDIVEIMPPAEEHPMPCEQHIVGKWRGERAVEINHHLSNPSFVPLAQRGGYRSLVQAAFEWKTAHLRDRESRPQSQRSLLPP